MLLVAALILISTPQGPMEVHADIPRWLCGRAGEGALTPILGPKTPITIRVSCSKR